MFEATESDRYGPGSEPTTIEWLHTLIWAGSTDDRRDDVDIYLPLCLAR